MDSESGSQKRSGILLAYTGTAISTLGTLVLTPLLTSSLGIDGFGLYQLAIAYAGYLIILSFGMRIIVNREVSHARATQGLEQLPQNLGLLRLGLVVPLLLLGIGSAVLAALVVPLLGNSVPPSVRPEFMAIYWLTIATLATGFLSDFPGGIAAGFERFRVVYGLSVVRSLVRIALVVALLEAGFGAVAVAAADFVLTLLAWAFLTIFVRRSIGVRISLRVKWNRTLAQNSTNLGLALMLAGLASVVTGSMDKVILGALTSTSEVAIYSIALILLTASGTLTLSVGQVFTPSVMRAVSGGTDRAANTSLIVEPGRLQFAIGGLILGGFIIFGYDFIDLWLGEEYRGAYWPTIILIVPNLLISAESLVFAILDARMKRMVRSIVTVVGAAVNIGLTFLLVRELGFIGAALATAITRLLFEIIVLNVYYHRYLDIDVPTMFRAIARGILPVLLVTSVLFFALHSLAPSGIVSLVGLGAGFCMATAWGLWRFGLNDRERSHFEPILARLRR